MSQKIMEELVEGIEMANVAFKIGKITELERALAWRGAIREAYEKGVDDTHAEFANLMVSKYLYEGDENTECGIKLEQYGMSANDILTTVAQNAVLIYKNNMVA